MVRIFDLPTGGLGDGSVAQEVDAQGNPINKDEKPVMKKHDFDKDNVKKKAASLMDQVDRLDGLIEDDDVTAWASATTDQKNRALYTATQRIDRERFLRKDKEILMPQLK